MPRPLRVFLCHASQDKPAVRELYNALKEEGWIDPWLDKAKILPGQDWEIVIEKAVEVSDVVVICLSSQSVSKEGFVQREIRYAYDIALEKPEETIFLIPLRLDDCNVPRKLRSFHWVDYFGSEKKGSYLDLLEALKLRYEQKMNLEDGDDEHEIANPKKRNTASRGEVDKVETQDFFETLSDTIWKYGKPWIWFGSFFLLGLLFLGINALLNREPAAPLPGQSTVTATASTTITPTLPTRPPATHTPTATRTPPPSITPTTTFGIGSTLTSEKDGMVMVFVPAGEFTMGSDTGDLNERPAHQVYLEAFWIDQTEVTNAMFSEFIEETNHITTAESVRSSPVFRNGNWFSVNRADWSHPLGPASNITNIMNHPVVHVSWEDASAYCEWAGKRLPSEAEWEKAARGADGRTYPWGNQYPDTKLLSFSSGVRNTKTVGSYPAGASVYGAHDMAGNVWEWLNDWYDSNYYSSSPSSNPQGPSSGEYKVLRGRSSGYSYSYVRSAYRAWSNPTISYDLFGFRCSLSQP
jgi:formylglycine-generating enzyme required for sulfatase activity